MGERCVSLVFAYLSAGCPLFSLFLSHPTSPPRKKDVDSIPSSLSLSLSPHVVTPRLLSPSLSQRGTTTP